MEGLLYMILQLVQIDYEMTATINGNLAGYLLYSDADDQPYINIQTYDRRVATALLQALQKKYNDIPINFGMHTEDGGKLINSITHEVPNPNYKSWHAKRARNLLSKITVLEKELKENNDIMRALWQKSKKWYII